MPEHLLALMDLLSWAIGIAGTLCLAFAVGVPHGSAAEMSAGGKYYKFAFVFAGRWRWGLVLIAFAFLLQLPKVVLGLISR